MIRFMTLIVIVLSFSSVGFSADVKTGDAIFDAYSKIGAALSQDQLSDAVKHAQALQKVIAATDQKQAKELMPDVESLANAKSLDDARKSYERLSSNLNTRKSELEIQANEYYCPMVKKTWLQKDTKVMNPYAGKDMATCGEKKSKS
jgi:hypothetical protein